MKYKTYFYLYLFSFNTYYFIKVLKVKNLYKIILISIILNKNNFKIKNYNSLF